MCADGVRVNVVAVSCEVGRVFDAALREAVFPDGHFGFEAEGESAFDELHGFLDGDVRRGREEEMDVIGHEDEGVDRVASFGAIVVEKLKEEVCVDVGLEETATIRGDGGDEESAKLLRGEFGHAFDVSVRRGDGKDYEGMRRVVVEGYFWSVSRPGAKALSLFRCSYSTA